MLGSETWLLLQLRPSVPELEGDPHLNPHQTQYASPFLYLLSLKPLFVRWETGAMSGMFTSLDFHFSLRKNWYPLQCIARVRLRQGYLCLCWILPSLHSVLIQFGSISECPWLQQRENDLTYDWIIMSAYRAHSGFILGYGALWGVFGSLFRESTLFL